MPTTGELKQASCRKGIVDVLQNSEKLWTTKKFHFPKYFLYHILSTSPRFIFYPVHPTVSQSVISLNIPLTYWSRNQVVENLSKISDKHTKKSIQYSFYKSVSLTLWIFYYCRKTEIQAKWWEIFLKFSKDFNKSLKRRNCDLQDYKYQEQLSHLMEDFVELKERMSSIEGKITEHGKNSET